MSERSEGLGSSRHGAGAQGNVRDLINRLRSNRSRPSSSSLPQPSLSSSNPRPRSPHTHRSVSEELAARFRGGSGARSSVARRHRPPLPEKAGKTFVRNVFLIPDPDTIMVPKGVDRQKLYENGYVVSFLELNTSWNEEKVRDTIMEAFQDVLPSPGESVPPM